MKIATLSDAKLRVLLSSFQPALVGLALKTCSQDFQQRVLSLLNRDAAETAFDSMNSIIDNQMANVRKAQKVILEALS